MEPTFKEIQAQIQGLYQKGAYGTALDLATQNAVRFPDKAPFFNYWMISMTACLNQEEESLRLLLELITSGFWYAETLLRKSPALASLQGDPNFEKLVEKNLHNQSADQDLLYPLLTLRPEGKCQMDGIPCPVLIALHNNASTAQIALGFWKTVPNNGWLLAVPQSSQALWKDAYVWDDLEISSGEVRKHYRSLLQRYAVDQRNILLAGHDMGAQVAIWLSLTGLLPSSGFIAIAPEGPFMSNIEKWGPYIEGAHARLEEGDRKLQGKILFGDKEHLEIKDHTREIVDMLNAAGIPCELNIIPGTTEELSPEIEAYIKNALDSIIS